MIKGYRKGNDRLLCSFSIQLKMKYNEQAKLYENII